MTDNLRNLQFKDLSCILATEDDLHFFELQNGSYLFGYEFARTDSLHRIDNKKCVGDISYAGGHGAGIIRGCGVTHISDEGKGIGRWLAIYGARQLALNGISSIAIDSLDKKAGEFWMHMAAKEEFPYSLRLRTPKDDKLPRTLVPTSGPHLIGVLK